MFRRKRREQAEQVVEAAAEPSRESGPWDADEGHPETDRIDLGGLRVPHHPAFDIRLAALGDQHVSVIALYEESTLQVQAVAAPKSAGLWEEVRTKITSTSSGLSEQDGPLGVELSGEVESEDGRRQIRYLGVDGPRWLLLAIISGRAAVDEKVGAEFVEFVKDIVVVRGTDPMAREEPIPLRRPNEATPQQEAGAPSLDPFKRGPEISEIR
ncbi:DUF3710 domain-containing protein [Nonomuraea typhae]|uniref:DUF3710 domain-containing protein n=1 Tax=Nonomuraea typhae TaxID=2603600 RepID=UPI0012FBAA32|nr:DUF3710 domain-containing protein [Nonomuraea typhae]